MLYLIGLGLDWKDISLKAVEAISKCDEVYLENYTSLVPFTKLQLERLIGKKIISLDRKQTEEVKPFLKNIHVKEVAILVYGDPLSATTHLEILQECRKKKLKFEIIHAPSIFTAIAETGLQLYKFGKVASIPEWKDNFRPESFVDIYEQNKSINAHTLFLLDIGLSPVKAIKQLLQAAKKRKLNLENTKAVVCINLGTPKSKIIYRELSKIKNSESPSCIIILAKLHFSEEEYLNSFK